MKNSRYQNLIKIIFNEKCKNIMEIGTYNGYNSFYMIETAKLFHKFNRVNYYGFDLFEDLTDQDLKNEFSKQPPSYHFVKKKLEKTRANIYLFKGNTLKTLPKFIEILNKKNERIDFVFIDGGHSIETITSDWNNVEKVIDNQSIIIFDDYYDNIKKEIEAFGCQSLINHLNRDIYQVKILKPQSQFKNDWGILKVNMVKVTRKSY